MTHMNVSVFHKHIILHEVLTSGRISVQFFFCVKNKVVLRSTVFSLISLKLGFDRKDITYTLCFLNLKYTRSLLTHIKNRIIS